MSPQFEEDNALARRPSLLACASVSLAILRSCSTSMSPLFEEDGAFAERPSLVACASVSLAILRSCSTSTSPVLSASWDWRWEATDGSVPNFVVTCSLFVHVLASLWSEVRSYLHKKCLDDANSAVSNPHIIP